MKTIYTIFICALITQTKLHSQSSVNHVFKQIQKTEKHESFSFPGWILRLGSKILVKSEPELKNSGLLTLVKKIKSIKVATTQLDITKYNTSAIVNNFIKKVQSKDNFEEYISVRSEDQNIRILIKEEKDIIKNLLILSADGADLAMIHVKTKIHIDDLKKISFADFTKEASALNKKETQF